SRSMMDDEEMEEERRLAYVGITRAERELYLTHAKMRTLYGRTNMNPVSRFIHEIPEDLIDGMEQSKAKMFGSFSRPKAKPSPSPSPLKRKAQKMQTDRKSTRLNSSHVSISYAVLRLKKKNYIVRTSNGDDLTSNTCHTTATSCA